MPNKDYYAVLGVAKTASADEIKKAFRRLAHEHHPDKGGDAAKFKDVNEAYQVLGDQKKRQTYDQFGSAAFEQGGGGPGGFGGFDPSGFPGGFNVNMNDFGDLGDMLGEMFGFGGRSQGGSRQARRGQDIAVDAELSFKEAIFGVTKDVTLVRPCVCESCKGDGSEPGTKKKSCATCNGSGQVRQTQRTLFGVMQVAAACQTCEGRGQIPEQVCKTCKGKGVTRREDRIQIPIPAGINEGDTLQVPGQGEAVAHGGRAGDLYLNVHVKKDPLFTREGSQIHSSIDVPYSTLLLGGSMMVETVDGPQEVSISERTPVGTKIVLKEKGVPSKQHGRRGDQIVHVSAQVPKKLTREQEAALESLRSLGL